MSSWADFAAAAPELAEHVRRTFAVREHATLATLRRDGSPRLSGTEVEFVDGELRLGMMAGGLKALDLQRDPRFALHCPTDDPPDADPSAWLGDGKVAGRAVELARSADGAHTFRLDLTEVVLTTVDGDHLLLRSWHPGRGVERRERR